ncbi:ABC transporter permease, partial [uncultured Desulfovibrio sp.]
MAARTHRVMCRLACRDYLREALLSACAVLGLAAVLTPLLVLYGVKFGVVQTLTDRLQHDPRNLEVSPVSSGRFTLQDVEKFAARPDVAFALPRTRAIAATMDLRNGKEGARKTVTASLEPSAAGDPLLARYGVPAPVMPAQPLAAPVEVTLSAPAAEKLGCSLGDTLTGTLERRYQGQVQRARVTLRVAGVLPLAAQQKDVAFVPLPLAQATEDYRDGRAVPELGTAQGWTGEPRPEGPRLYPGFRLYASSLEAVTGLREFFAGQGLEVYTHAAEIEQVTSLSRALNTVFALICAAAAAGFLASTASSALAGVKRKERMLGLLRLTGFGTGALLLFPLVQALLTALLGTATAMGVYAAAAAVINHLFAASLGDMEQVCRLLPRHVL